MYTAISFEKNFQDPFPTLNLTFNRVKAITTNNWKLFTD